MKQSRTVSFSDMGKRVVSLLLMLAMILTMVPHTTMAAADTTSEEGVAVVIDLSEVSDVPMYLFNYLQENGITESDVTALTLKGGSVHPSDLSFLTVTLNKVKILDLSETSIDWVPQGAILNKASLVEIRLPDSVTAIDSYAFFGCSNLESIRWPQNLETIGSQAFENCTKLEFVDLPDSVNTIGQRAFYNCTGLKSVVLPASLSTLGEHAFYGCANLESVDLSKTGLTEIPMFAFSDCVKLSSIAFPAQLTKIGQSAFSRCMSLTSLTFPATLTEIDLNAFRSCSALASITLPAEFKSIGQGAFRDCTSLREVYLLSAIPPTVDTGAFDNIAKYPIVHVPAGSGLNYLGTPIFDNTWNGFYIDDPDRAPTLFPVRGLRLNENVAGVFFYVDLYMGTRCYYAVVDDGADMPVIDTTGPGHGTERSGNLGFLNAILLTDLTSGPKDVYIVAKLGNKLSQVIKIDIAAETVWDVVIDNHVAGNLEQEIDDYLRSNDAPGEYSNIKSLTIIGDKLDEADQNYLNMALHSSMGAVEKLDFSGTSFELEEGVEILTGLFAHLDIVSVILPEGLTKISPQTFMDSKELESIVIPSSVTMIGYDAFSGCSNLSVVTLQSQLPPQVDVNAFASISQDAIAWVPAGTGAIYRAVDDGNTMDDKWYGLIVEDGSGTEKRIIMAQPVYKEVPWGTDGDHIGLPETVSVLLSDNSSIEVPVVWDTENYSGTISEWLYGIPVNLPAGIKNDLNIKAKAYVTMSLPVIPDVKPAVFSMDLSAPEDINAEITWNDFRIIRSIKLLSRLDIPSVAFSVEGNRITIKKEDILSFNPKAGESFVLKVDIAFEDYLTLVIEFAENSNTPGGGSSGGTPSGGGSSPSGGSGSSGSSPAPGMSDSSEKTVIPKETLKSASENKQKDFTINTSLASITFDSQALKTIAGEASEDVTVRVSSVNTAQLSDEVREVIGDRPVYDFQVTSGNKVISQFGGHVTVTIPYTPKAGEDINAIIIYYINGEGKLEVVRNCVYDPITRTIRFTTRHFSLYAVGYNKVDFKDVSASEWYSKAVTFIAAREITAGTGNGNFSPEAKLTRGQFMVMLLKAYDIAPDTNSADNFTDAGNTYYTGYLAAAKRLGITKGIGNNLFGPEMEITRQEAFTLLYNTLSLLNYMPKGASGKSLSSFSDAEDIAPWAKEAMTCLVEAGIISGSNGKLLPNSHITRAEMAQVLYNLLND